MTKPSTNAVTDQTNLGNILLRMGAVKLDRLKEAVVAQMEQHRDLRLGAVLAALGLVTHADLQYALQVQKLMRRGKGADAAMLVMDYQLNQGEKSADREVNLANAAMRCLTPPDGTPRAA